MRARVSRARDAERVVTPLELFFDAAADTVAENDGGGTFARERTPV